MGGVDSAHEDMRSIIADDDETYVDDANIDDGDLLLRRIPSWHIVWDKKDGGRWRPSSAAFENHPDGSPMSIRVRSLLEALGLALASVLTAYPDYGLVEFEAGEARSKKQVVARQEVPDEPGHGVVAGKKTGSTKKHLVRKSEWSLPLGAEALGKAEARRGPV